jgi:hypothetical protein
VLVDAQPRSITGRVREKVVAPQLRDITTFFGSSDLSVPPVAGFGSPRDVFNPPQIQFGFKLKF